MQGQNHYASRYLLQYHVNILLKLVSLGLLSCVIFIHMNLKIYFQFKTLKNFPLLQGKIQSKVNDEKEE